MNTLVLPGRLVAIMAADAVGFSRVMAYDEQGTVDALEVARSIFRAAVESHRGRIVDMAGDSVLATFDSATGAVLAALAIQAQLATSGCDQAPGDLVFRIGLHLGEVLEKPDGSVYGDGVNIAARVQASSPSGGVAVSDALRSAVGGRVSADFLDCGEQELKNIDGPIRIHHVRAQVPAREQRPAKRPHSPDGMLRRPVCAAAVAGTVIVGCLLMYQLERLPAVRSGANDAELPTRQLTRMTIVVLPLVNQTGNVEKDYVADGLTTNISSGLTKLRDVFVVPFTTAFAYKGKSLTVKQAATEAGVRFVLAGSVLAAGDNIRIYLQLSDSSTDSQLWTEAFEERLSNVRAMLIKPSISGQPHGVSRSGH